MSFRHEPTTRRRTNVRSLAFGRKQLYYPDLFNCSGYLRAPLSCGNTSRRCGGAHDRWNWKRQAAEKNGRAKRMTSIPSISSGLLSVLSVPDSLSPNCQSQLVAIGALEGELPIGNDGMAVAYFDLASKIEDCVVGSTRQTGLHRKMERSTSRSAVAESSSPLFVRSLCYRYPSCVLIIQPNFDLIEKSEIRTGAPTLAFWPMRTDPGPGRKPEDGSLNPSALPVPMLRAGDGRSISQKPVRSRRRPRFGLPKVPASFLADDDAARYHGNSIDEGADASPHNFSTRSPARSPRQLCHRLPVPGICNADADGKPQSVRCGQTGVNAIQSGRRIPIRGNSEDGGAAPANLSRY
jgi:hypothetical protein